MTDGRFHTDNRLHPSEIYRDIALTLNTVITQ